MILIKQDYIVMVFGKCIMSSSATPDGIIQVNWVSL